MEWASCRGMGILPVSFVRRQDAHTTDIHSLIQQRQKMRVSLLVVRYGADYPNTGYEAKNPRLSAPNAPYALNNLQPFIMYNLEFGI
ncbi:MULTISPECIES: hypothetical protein [unclassified Moorena]|uniref:hypothetical protein n=1 Tax=unclassified Moorena TaxID=2683338 RepID=UPI001400399D|nr:MULTISPECIES: hypothetical protein [unclassified Moorena]NEO15551.1 hypothetical protein [Moorena sp. SIO3E8]NEQ01964.1 hypothetical protein [Moorena sp. SIO3F7]